MSETGSQIEAVLFASGKKVTYEELARLCNTDISEIKNEIQQLKRDYELRESPIILTEEADGWRMTVREKYLSLVHKMLPETELSKSVLETLAVIAWKQPVLQSEVIRIRTNKAYDDIQELVERGFISKEKSGRSYMLKVTNKFKEYFELPSREAIKKIFKDIQEHIKREEALGQEKEHLGSLEVYEEQPAAEAEKPGIRFYDSEREKGDEEQPEEPAEAGRVTGEELPEENGEEQPEETGEAVAEEKQEKKMPEKNGGESSVEKESVEGNSVGKEQKEEGRELSEELEELIGPEKNGEEEEK